MHHRRGFLRRSAALAATPLASGLFDDARSLIVRGDRPLNLETPVDLLTDWLTPADLLFVRSHFGPPAVGLHPWTIRVQGLVAQPRTLDIGGLSGFPSAEVVAVLQCSGNGRALFEPAIGGVPWQRGAVGNARWTGVRLRDLLESSRLLDSCSHVHFYGGDPPPNPKTPAFVRSIPIERALDPSTTLATHINGQPLPIIHGGPVRLVVPGWTANHWMKWVRAIVCGNEEAPGFYQRTAYRIADPPVPAGAEAPPETLHPVTWMNVKSLITSPRAGAEIAGSEVVIRGVAWTGRGRIERVEIALDDAPWQPAALLPPDVPHAWRLWEAKLKAASGAHRARARATDSEGEIQPERAAWNKSGYLWNGIETVEFTVNS